ncbi:MAG: hypothetical protein EOM05_05245 [Clostridia bacterium]|nr:hypothetical protein [Clostridia bacterium]
MQSTISKSVTNKNLVIFESNVEGIQYIPGALDYLETMKVTDKVSIKRVLDNEHNSNAIHVIANNNHPIGFVGYDSILSKCMDDKSIKVISGEIILLKKLSERKKNLLLIEPQNLK